MKLLFSLEKTLIYSRLNAAAHRSMVVTHTQRVASHANRKHPAAAAAAVNVIVRRFLEFYLLGLPFPVIFCGSHKIDWRSKLFHLNKK